MTYSVLHLAVLYESDVVIYSPEALDLQSHTSYVFELDLAMYIHGMDNDN